MLLLVTVASTLLGDARLCALSVPFQPMLRIRMAWKTHFHPSCALG
jgi:hypothetical protein